MDIRKHVSRIGWAYVVFLVVSSAAQMVVNFGLGLMFFFVPSWVLDENFLMLLSQLTMYLVGFPVLLLLLRRIPSWRMTEPKTLGVGHFLIMIVVCLGATYLGNLIGSILMMVTGGLTGNGSTNPLLEAIGDMNLGMVALTTVIIAPIMEELVFRKLLIDRLAPLGQKTAVVVSGLSFGLFHGNFYQFFYASLLGMIFAYLYSYTGKVRYNIALHMIVNTVGGVVAIALTRGVSQGSLLAIFGMGLLGLVMGVTILATIILTIINLRRLTWFEGWLPSEHGMVRTFFTAPGVWGFILSCAVMFIAMGVLGMS